MILKFKNYIASLIFFLSSHGIVAQNVGIGTTTPESSAMLHVSSTTKGLLLPRMTSAQRTAIASPATGLMVYQTDQTTGVYMYSGTGWKLDADKHWVQNGNNIYNANSGNVGIGTAAPSSLLHLQSADIVDVPRGDIILSRYWLNNTDTRASSIFHYNNPISTSDNLAFGVAGDGGSFYEPNSIDQIKMLIQANGNVGIGTNSPAAKLDVAGTIKITDGSEGIGKVLTSDANGLAAWATLNNTIASGTAAGNTPYWNGTTWVTNSSNIFNNGGNTGIGTTSPSAKLDVAGTIKITDGSEGIGKVLTSDANGLAAWATLNNTIASGTAAGNTPYWNGTTWVTNSSNIFNNGGNTGIGTTSPSAKLNVRSTSNTAFRIDGNTGQDALSIGGIGKVSVDAINIIGGRFTILDNGNTGIGNNSPAAKLDVAGSVKITDGTQGNGKVLTSDANGLATWTTLATQIGAGTAAGNTPYWNGTIWVINSSNIFNNGGNTGIGTITPAAKLDVLGTVKIADGTQGNGKVLTSDASGLAAWATPNNTIASGTAAGNTPYWNGTTWVTNSSNIFNNGGNTGIGTITPAAKLDVAGTLKITDGSQGIGKVLTSDASGLAAWATPATQIASGTAAGNTPYWNGTTWVTNSSNIFNNGGNTGIGTITPVNKLSVNGNADITGNVGIGTTTPAAKLNVSSTSNTALRIDGNTGQNALSISGTGLVNVDAVGAAGGRFTILDNGNTGIGTNSPQTNLDVNGGIRTKYSGTAVIDVVGTAIRTLNITIPALPAGWDVGNTVVIVTNADGVDGIIRQAKLTSLTNIQVKYIQDTNGLARFNWIIFKI